MAYNALFLKTFFHMFSAATMGCTKQLNDHVTMASPLGKVWTVPNGYIAMTYHWNLLTLIVIDVNII